jgi:hypothetical protein
MNGKRIGTGVVLAALLSWPLASEGAVPTGNMQLWLRADAEVETGGTPSGTTFTAGAAANDNDFITAWRDQSANAFDAYAKDTAAAASIVYEPRYRTTGGPNGQPYLSFGLGPTSAEYARLGLNTALLTGNGDFSILSVVRFNTTAAPAAEKIVAANYGVGDSTGVEFYHFSGALRLYKQGSAVTGGSLLDGQWHLVQGDRVGNTLNIYVDNQLAASQVLAMTAITGNRNWTIGNAPDYPAVALGDLAEQIVYSDDLSSADRLAASAALAEKYGLTQVVVPEPASLALLAVGGALLLRRR